MIAVPLNLEIGHTILNLLRNQSFNQSPMPIPQIDFMPRRGLAAFE